MLFVNDVFSTPGFCPSYHTSLLPLHSLRAVTTTTRCSLNSNTSIYITNGNTKAESTRNSFLCEATLRPIGRPTNRPAHAMYTRSSNIRSYNKIQYKHRSAQYNGTSKVKRARDVQTGASHPTTIRKRNRFAFDPCVYFLCKTQEKLHFNYDYIHKYTKSGHLARPLALAIALSLSFTSTSFLFGKKYPTHPLSNQHTHTHTQ